MIKAVVFDLDGTLLDTRDDIAEAHNRALRHFGFPERALDEFNAIIGGGIMEAIAKAAPAGTPRNILIELHKLYQAYYPEHSTVLSSPYEGMAETVGALEEKGLAVAVFTNKTESTAISMTKHFFPKTDFKFIWGNDGVRPLKPESNAGSDICRFLGFAAEEIAYIGDSDTDMIFASRTGMLPVGACWGYRGREELERAGAIALAECPTDLLKFV